MIMCSIQLLWLFVVPKVESSSL